MRRRRGRALVAVLQCRWRMWLVLQRILAGIGRALRRLWGALSARGRRGARPGLARAAPLTPHVRT